MDWIEARVCEQDIDFCEMDHENKAWKVRSKEKKPAWLTIVYWVMCWRRKQGNEKENYTSVEILTLQHEPWHPERSPCVFIHAWTRTLVLGNVVHVCLHLCTFFHDKDWLSGGKSDIGVSKIVWRKEKTIRMGQGNSRTGCLSNTAMHI